MGRVIHAALCTGRTSRAARAFGAMIVLTYSLAVVFSPQDAHAANHSDRGRKIATTIRSKYESCLASLEPEEQRHFAVRMYRMTGDTGCVGPIIADLQRAIDDLRRDLAGRGDARYVKQRTDRLLADFSTTTRKGRQRAELFGQDRDALFDLNLLTNTKRVAEHRSAEAEPDSLLTVSLQYLRGIDFSRILLDTSAIRIYSPQLVNSVYYLYDLGITDLRQPYTDAFRRVFPDSRDLQLSRNEFRDKIYGLTHFILAASDYYQHLVDSTEFTWILDYFARRIDRIMIATTSDIIAEVGICFLLTGTGDHATVARCRDQICRRFDQDSQMLLSPHGSDDVQKGEHRNILACMLLDWPDTLYPGPYVPAHH